MKQFHLINVLQLVFTSLFFVSAVFFVTHKSDLEYQTYIEDLTKSNPVYTELTPERTAFPAPPRTFSWDIATISLIITAIGTFFAIFFRWRADIRNSKIAEEQAKKIELRFKELEYEIKLIKAKLK